MTRRPRTEIVSPVMVGAMTVLVTAMAMFLSYNAGSGLPFVPTYNIGVRVPDTQELVPNNEVLVGGRRVGVIASIEAEMTEEGDPYALMNLKLEQDLEGQVHGDATARVRSRSLLGAKYLELTLGESGDSLEFGETLPLSRARENVEVDEVVDELDPPTRINLARVLGGVGTGFASRGLDFNSFLEALDPLLEDARPVLSDLAAPGTRFDRLIRAFAATASELGAAPQDLASILNAGAATFAAIEAGGPELERLIERSPETLATGTEALAVLGPVLAKGRVITARLVPAAKLLPSTLRRLSRAAKAGTPALRKARILGPALNETLVELEGLAATEPTVPALNSLAGVLPELRPAVEFLAPYQTVCNYVALGARNLASTPSEGNASGNWLRFNAILQPSEMLQAAAPAPELHFNPYPNGAAPGQPQECEGGREPYLPGQVIGNLPGNQGLGTEATTPQSVAAVSD